MVQPSSTIPGINYQQVTTTGSGSHAQQAFAKQQANATTQNNANQLSGGAIALPPMQSGTSPAQVALSTKVQQGSVDSAAKSVYDCQSSNSCPTKGGRRRSRTNKRKTIKNKRKSRRNNKKSKRRRTKSSRK
jgi:hypothetical protein